MNLFHAHITHTRVKVAACYHFKIFFQSIRNSEKKDLSLNEIHLISCETFFLVAGTLLNDYSATTYCPTWLQQISKKLQVPRASLSACLPLCLCLSLSLPLSLSASLSLDNFFRIKKYSYVSFHHLNSVPYH